MYHKDWGENYCFNKIKEIADEYFSNDSVTKLFSIDNLTIERAKDLRFKMFDDEQYPNLYLFPLWFALLLPYGTKVVSINGEEFEYTKDTDLDICFGCVAFGINLYK